MLGIHQGLHQLLEFDLQRHGDDIRARHTDLADPQIADLQHVAQQGAFRGFLRRGAVIGMLFQQLFDAFAQAFVAPAAEQRQQPLPECSAVFARLAHVFFFRPAAVFFAAFFAAFFFTVFFWAAFVFTAFLAAFGFFGAAIL